MELSDTMSQTTTEQKIQLMEEAKKEIFGKNKFDPELLLIKVRADLRKSICMTVCEHSPCKLHNLVGIFAPNNIKIKTSDIGTIKGREIIKKLSKDLSKNFVVLTENGLEYKLKDKSFFSKDCIVSLNNGLEKTENKENRPTDFSDCLGSVVDNAIFILNNSGGSAVVHEIHAFHRKKYNNDLSVGVLFSQRTICPLLKKKKNIYMCPKLNNLCNKMHPKCDFSKHITKAIRNPFMQKNRSFLSIVTNYKDLLSLFKKLYKDKSK